MVTQTRIDIAGVELPELEQALHDLGHPRFHGRQIFQWIHKRGVSDFALMSDLSRELRATLAAHFDIDTPGSSAANNRPTAPPSSCSGWRRQAHRDRLHPRESFRLHDLADADRVTFCVSTQVGCAMRCAFCLTGKMGIDRNLTAGEIVGQVRVLVRELNLADTASTSS